MGAATIDAARGLCLPLLTDQVYEFAARADREAGRPGFLGLHEIVPGEDYYVFVTTRSGLYRYDINDIVRAAPGVAGCPGLRFLQKGRGVTSITGEKLSEHQLIAAVTETLTARRLDAATFLALADEDAARYELWLEGTGGADVDELAAAVDAGLRARNVEYDDKRAGGRLGPLRVRRLRDGASDAIRRASVARGVREAQYKPVVLDVARHWRATLAPLAADPVAAADGKR
jgi:hypothetical protein